MMEDLDPPESHHPLSEVEEENTSLTPPTAAPRQEVELAEDKLDLSDNDSILSDIDEAQFEDFDPSAIAIAVDESNVGLIGTHKRKKTDGEVTEKKKKEGRREKPKKARRQRDDDDNFEGGEELEGKRIRKKKDILDKPEKTRARKASPEIEEDLSPEERRRRALDRAMDDALKNPSRRHKRLAGYDLDQFNDDLIENMRIRMTEAAKADTNSRQNGQPAMEKLKLLPEVVALLNRNNLRDQLVDPEINLLEAVRFFLEPLNDGSLPAYNIQRDLFATLAKLPINKEALVASGIGKVTLFYTKSKFVEATIQRNAEKLLVEWTRPILKRSDDYRKRELIEASYDPKTLPVRSAQAASATAAAVARERKLAAPIRANRARVEGGLSSYTVVPKSNVTIHQMARQAPSAGDDVFKHLIKKGSRK